MRPLQLLALSGLMLASNIALAAELERDDIPHRCWDVCSPVVDTAQQCDSTYRDDDRAEMDCICGWNQASTLVPLCEACIAEYRSSNDHDDDDDDDDDDDRNEVHDNDAYDILTSCSFSTTTYNTAAASSILSTATSTVATNSATTTQSSSGSSSTGSSGTTGTSQSSSNTNTGSNAQATNNSAAGSAVPKAASVAAVVGLIGLAWL